MWLNAPSYKEKLDHLIQLRNLFSVYEVGGFQEGENRIVDVWVIIASSLVGGCQNSREYTAFIFRMKMNSFPITSQYEHRCQCVVRYEAIST